MFRLSSNRSLPMSLITRYLRHTGTGRESGYIYRRTKRALAPVSAVPVAGVPGADRTAGPAWDDSTFFVYRGVAVRVTVAYFK